MTNDYRLISKRWQTPAVVLAGGCLISVIGFGARSSYGLYLGPMTGDLGWSREIFALAMALQNLFWGLCLPFAGILADRHGPVWFDRQAGFATTDRLVHAMQCLDARCRNH